MVDGGLLLWLYGGLLCLVVVGLVDGGDRRGGEW